MASNFPSVGMVLPRLRNGGLENIVFDLCDGISKEGGQVTIFVEESIEDTHLDSKWRCFEITHINNPESNFFSELAARHITIVHFHYSTFMIDKISSVGIKTSYTLHNLYTWMTDAEFLDHAALVLRSHRVIAVSEIAADYFVERASRLCL